jgi:AraC-like DNA-binding protein
MMNLEVQVDWAQEHRWHGGQCLRRLHTSAYAVWLILEGTIDLSLLDWPGPQQEWRLKTGDAFLAPAPCIRDVIAGKPGGAHWLTLGLTATISSLGSTDLIARIGPPFLWRPNPDEGKSLENGMRACILQTNQARHTKDELNRFIQQSLAGAIFGFCWRARFGDQDQSFAQTARRHLPDWLTWLLERIETDPARSLAEWQPQLTVSPAQIRRVFHRYMGVSPQIYLTTRRLETAKSLLSQTDRTAGEIARMIGFESQAHFTRRFKDQFGKTPLQYRLDARSPKI